jgi:hypothetical protein
MNDFASTLRHFALSSLGRVLSRSLAEGCLRHQHAAGERLCQRYLLRSVEAEYRKLGMLSPLSGMASPNERASKFRDEVLQRAGREQLSQQSEEQG